MHGLDVLRGVAMTLGIFLHGTIAYKSGYHYGEWTFDPAYKSFFFDWLYLWINSFRMQLFFLLAGFFAHLLIHKIGLPAFFKNRFKRIAVPLFLCYFTILPLTLLPYQYVLFETNGDPWPQLADFFVNFFMLRDTSGFMHLWFLQHLVVFYCLAITYQYLRDRATGMQKVQPNLYKTRLERLTAPGVLLTTVVIVGIISQMFSTPLPNIWTGFIIPPAQFLYYAAFFIFGWILEPRRKLFFSFKKLYPQCLIGGTILSFLTLYLVQSYVFLPSFSASHALLKGLYALQTVLLTFGFIGFFTHKFNAPNTFWRYIADSAYWVYLIHLPIVLGTQLLLTHSDVPGILRFPIVLAVAIVISFGTYHLCVRYTWIGYLLNGRRMVRKQENGSPSTAKAKAAA